MHDDSIHRGLRKRAFTHVSGFHAIRGEFFIVGWAKPQPNPMVMARSDHAGANSLAGSV